MSIKSNFKYTVFASYIGYFVQAIINNFLPLLFLTFQKSFGLSYSEISLLIVINFAVQLVIDVLSAGFVDRLGYRKSIVGAHFLAAAGLLGLSVFPFVFERPYFGIIAAIVLYAAGSGLIEVIISPLVEACPTKNKAGQMSLLHSFYCWGQMCVAALSTLFFFLFGIQNWRILSCLWAVVPICNGFFLSAVAMPEKLSEFRGLGIRQLFEKKLFRVFAVIMLCSGASEIAMSQWASAFAESGLGVSKSAADLLGPCLFAVLMGAARTVYAFLSEKISLKKIMTASAALCVFSYLLTAFSPVPALSLLGCGLCGLSVGVMWPGTFSLAAGKIDSGGTVMFAMLALFGDIGCSAGPAVVGTAAGAAGNRLEAGIAAAAVFPALLLLMLTKIKDRKETNAH